MLLVSCYHGLFQSLIAVDCSLISCAFSFLPLAQHSFKLQEREVGDCKEKEKQSPDKKWALSERKKEKRARYKKRIGGPEMKGR